MSNESTFSIDVGAEVERFFDDSSIPHEQQPRIVILMGGVAGGKTTIRKKHYSTGYVLVDAAEIFLSLSRGGYFPFPTAFEEPMDIIGSLVARRAIAERRHVVTEIIGAKYESITCDVEEAVQRNRNRDDDSISAYYAEPFQRRWLIAAATEAHTTSERSA